MKAIYQNPTNDERKLASLAHGSILVTFIISVFSSGLATLLPLLIPMYIGWSHKDRSKYVTFHAWQAATFQVSVMIFMLVLGTVLGIAWGVTTLLMPVLIGFLLLPVAIVLSVVIGITLFFTPLSGLAYGLIAAWEVYHHDNFRYRLIANWVENRL
ncbi:MAG: hypothetical protein B6242_01570 [Anaerolineaceae bacterium 4572_78]|nr:MAG: hypothetical protein B6242_01570 [Anaerolineaceae bacterium 4572_78]